MMPDFLTFIKKQERFFPAGVFVLMICLYLPQIFLRDPILRDVASRYAPMADAFASGDFKYAFHPRVSSLHPLISGCFSYITGCSGFIGTQLSALFFLGLCVFPLFRLLKQVFDRETAVWGTLLLPFVSQVTAVSVSGLRESHKLFALLLISSGLITVFKEREKYCGYLLAGAGGGLAFCIRIDLVLPALALITAAGMMEFAALKSLKRSLAGVFIALVFFIFETAVNHSICGQAVPGSHYLRVLQYFPPQVLTFSGILIYVVLPCLAAFAVFSVTGGWLLRFPFGKKLPFLAVILLVVILSGNILWQLCHYIGLTVPDRIKLFYHFSGKVLGGVNPPLFLLAAIGIFSLKVQKKWDEEQAFLLFLFFVWILGIIFQIVMIENHVYVSKRYLLPVSVLLSGWGVHGIVFCGRKLRDAAGKRGEYLLRILFAVLPVVCLYHAYSNVLEYKFKREKKEQIQTQKTIADVIRHHYSGPAYFTPEFSFYDYRGNRCPKIAFVRTGKEAAAAYRSGGSIVSLMQDPDFVVAPAEKVFSEKEWLKAAENLPFGKISLHVWKRKRSK